MQRKSGEAVKALEVAQSVHKAVKRAAVEAEVSIKRYVEDTLRERLAREGHDKPKA
jgi:predicted HicB family RNase H-like nuclease